MNAAEIAAKLSKAQVWAVRTGLHPTGPRREPMEKSLQALGLWRADGTFTPLCQTVRAILQTKEPTNDPV
jgi:hypothetical protein